MPTISISSPTLTTPRSIRPVTTVPRPEIENTSSTGIRNGFSMSRLGCGIHAVQRFDQLDDRSARRFRDWSPSSAFSAEPLMIGVSSPGKLYFAEQLTHFHLDELEQLGVVDHVRLVHVHHDVRHADLARQQDVLARLRHRAVRRRHDQDRAVHLRGTRDHVLHVVRVARAVDVRVVAVRRSRIPRAPSRS